MLNFRKKTTKVCKIKKKQKLKESQAKYKELLKADD